MYVGKRIRELRETKRMTLTELARRSGVQIATLSRMENEKMTGTLESHMNISRALGIDLTDLYSKLKPRPPQEDAVIDDSSTETFTYNPKASYEILTGKVLSKKMMPIVLKLDKGGKTNPEQNPPGSEQFIFVLQGKITAHVGGKPYPLPAKNSLYFDASLEHYFQNTGTQTAKMISVVTPVIL